MTGSEQRIALARYYASRFGWTPGILAQCRRGLAYRRVERAYYGARAVGWITHHDGAVSERSVQKGDRIHVAHPVTDSGSDLFDTNWPAERQQGREVWHNGERVNLGGVRRITRQDAEHLIIQTHSQKLTVKEDTREAAPGQLAGEVTDIVSSY